MESADLVTQSQFFKLLPSMAKALPVLEWDPQGVVVCLDFGKDLFVGLIAASCIVVVPSVTSYAPLFSAWIGHEVYPILLLTCLGLWPPLSVQNPMLPTTSSPASLGSASLARSCPQVSEAALRLYMCRRSLGLSSVFVFLAPGHCTCLLSAFR